jgi:hypothetical protein
MPGINWIWHTIDNCFYKLEFYLLGLIGNISFELAFGIFKKVVD